jgi:RNA polymerase sigma-70 factor (ECF subfamily)
LFKNCLAYTMWFIILPVTKMSMLNPDNEQALIQQARRGDAAALDAFNGLVLRYQDSVYTLALRIMIDPASADDVTQAAFIAAYQRLETYQGGSFKAWLLRITTNQAYDELRRLKRRPSVSVDELPGAASDDGAPLPDPADTPEQINESRELQRAIQRCIDALSDDYRVVLVMCDLEDYDYSATAAVLGIAQGTVKSRLSRARSNVRDCLQAVQELLPARFRLKGDG